jgi:hypothetical protein
MYFHITKFLPAFAQFAPVNPDVQQHGAVLYRFNGVRISDLHYRYNEASMETRNKEEKIAQFAYGISLTSIFVFHIYLPSQCVPFQDPEHSHIGIISESSLHTPPLAQQNILHGSGYKKINEKHIITSRK